MSTQLFPTVNIKWSVKRAVLWKTKKQTSVTGMETRIPQQAMPRYQWTLDLPVLREGQIDQPTPYTEFSEFEGFFESLLGGYDTFLWTDSDDNTVTEQALGVGNGVQTVFKLMRTLGGSTTQILAPNFAHPLRVFTDDWEGLQEVYRTPRTNYLLQSTSFASSWSLAGATIASGYADPLGGTTAIKIVESSANAEHSIYQQGGLLCPKSVPVTFSAVVAASGRSKVVLTFTDYSGIDYSAWFDLNAVTANQLANAPTVGIEAMPLTGWFRVWINMNSNGGTGEAVCTLGPSITGVDGGIYLGGGTNGIRAYGAQLEVTTTGDGSPTAYIPTTSVPVTVTDYFCTGWGDLNSNGPGSIIFATPPNNGSLITGNFSYFWPVRFDDDTMTFEKFVGLRYKVGGVKFTSVLS